MPTEQTVNHINTVLKFLAVRDIEDISYVKEKGKKATLTLVLGNEVIETITCLEHTINNPVSEYLMFSGGVGHSTKNLIANVESLLKKKIGEGAEADIMADTVVDWYGFDKTEIITENKSTNTGENINFTFETLKKRNIMPKSIILIQDPILQMRSFLTLKKYINTNGLDTQIINFAPFVPTFHTDKEIRGMKRFISLLYGEIYRLKDDVYGPLGSGFIEKCHVDERTKKAMDSLEECKIREFREFFAE